MPRYKHIDDLMHPRTHPPCAREGCLHQGEHRAPLSRDRPGQYQFLCLEHVQEFNKKWDYFQHMSQHEIEDFQRDATFGHRPTWKINEADKKTAARLEAAFGRFMGFEFTPPNAPQRPPISSKDHKALADLDLDHPATRDEIKRTYKKLVKKYHPDRNPNNKQAEERFKQITLAYHYLIAHYCEPSL